VIDRLFDHHGAVPLPFAAVSKRFCCAPHPGRAACVSCSHVNSNKNNDLEDQRELSRVSVGCASSTGVAALTGLCAAFSLACLRQRAVSRSCSHVNNNKTNDLMNPGIWSADFHGVASASGSHPFSV